ncbi:hypothetical protein [Ramlibacter humi]|uniref:Uncharacterized protein n=1 Tax=Ramlibacter humi TaxID=2530451 RepID=A0A4Z0CB80_9BURK|nr:hypothetical protein [Ramlibacter humi]TFZ08591.1 hypothetical protein EZ216_05400 [Ramlibacter humi]
MALPDTAPSLALDARRQDSHWSRAFRGEPYFRAGREYEDYAPAYCVGYVGYAQYGGRFEDALRSLWANWERIRGASRLTTEEALPAFRAAWDRVEAQEALAGRMLAAQAQAVHAAAAQGAGT